MLEVLAHRRSNFPHSSVVFFVFLFFFSFQPRPARATFQSVNGQIFTSGLAILDAPAPDSIQHTGSNLSIAIDISGDGKLPLSATMPGSNAPTRYDSLEIYLVSGPCDINMTVSQGPGLLTQEYTSTVKHLDSPMPDCLCAGEYNLTLYELSHINGQDFFSITPIPISIQNNSPTSDPANCTASANPVLDQPQPSSPPPQNPWLTPSGPVTNNFPPGDMTVTIGSTGIIWPSAPSGTVTVTATQPQTVISTQPPVTVTAVVVSLETSTVTSTAQGTTSVFTTVLTSSSTTTAIFSSGTAGGAFFPVNGASPRSPSFLMLTGAIALATTWLLPL